jgi:hypothetical protein
LFTASYSGWTRFTIQNNGNIAATGTLTGLTGLTLASGPITLGASTGSSQCLIGGATASWGSCSTGVVGTNYWNLTNGNGFANQGYITPINSTADLLIGGQSTASATFAVLGLATNSISGVGGHQTTASVSGQFVVMPNNGYGGNASISGNLTVGAFGASSIQATNNQLLTIGGNTTGNITLSPLSAAAGSVINLNATNINSSLATVNELATPTTITYGGATTSLTLGGASATITLNGTTIATNQTTGTLALFNTGLTGTLNFAGLASSVSIGANNLLLGAASSTSGNIKFQVIGSSTSTAAAQLWNAFPNTGNAACTSSFCHTALSLRLGTNNGALPGSGDRYINFATGNGTIIGKIQGNAGSVALSSTGGDYAEWFRKANVNDVLNPGDLVCLSSNGGVVKCDNNNTQLLGVISNSYIVVGNDSHEDDPDYVVVGLLGQLKTAVNSQNGTINPGDYLTYSATPGVACKATTAGPVIGKAVDGGTGGQINAYINPTWYDPQVQLTSSGNLNLVDQTTADTNYTVPHYYTLNDTLGNPLQRVGEFSAAAIANLRVGLVNAQQITTNALSVATDNITINGQNLKDYITGIVTGIINSTNNNVVSPIASVDEMHTNFISPIDSTANIALKLENNQLSVLNGNTASSSAVATIDNQGNASFSGQLTSTSLTTNEATVSGTLHVGNLVADQINGASASATYVTNVTNIYNSSGSASNSDFGLIANAATASTSSATGNQPLASGNYIDISSYSGQLAYVDNLAAANATFSQGLMVFGQTSLADTAIVGQLSVNGSLILADNSINVLGSDLNLQPLRQGGVSIMGGLVYIDTDGNLKVGGNAEFAKNVTVNGTLATNVVSPLPGSDLSLNTGNSNLQVTNASNTAVLNVNPAGDLIASGEGTFAKLNLNLVQPALAVSPTELTASGSAGTANISAYQTQVTIDDSLVTDKSLIYITPTSNTNNQVLYLLRQVPGQSFTVGLQNPAAINIPFNWIIVN